MSNPETRVFMRAIERPGGLPAFHNHSTGVAGGTAVFKDGVAIVTPVVALSLIECKLAAPSTPADAALLAAHEATMVQEAQGVYSADDGATVTIPALAGKSTGVSTPDERSITLAFDSRGKTRCSPAVAEILKAAHKEGATVELDAVAEPVEPPAFTQLVAPFVVKVPAMAALESDPLDGPRFPIVEPDEAGEGDEEPEGDDNEAEENELEEEADEPPVVTEDSTAPGAPPVPAKPRPPRRKPKAKARARK